MIEIARRAAEELCARFLAISAVATLFVSTWLASFSQALALDENISVDAFLAWRDGASAAMLDRWDTLQMLDLARIALIGDLVLFIPAYGVFFCAAAAAFGRQLRLDAARIDVASWLYPQPRDARERGVLARICRFLSLDHC